MHWGPLVTWLGVTLHRHGSHLVPAHLLIQDSLCWGSFVVLSVIRTVHQSPHRICSLELHETNESHYIHGCLHSANALWVPSIHRLGPHRSTDVVAGGVAVHGRLTHWTGISHFCLISMSYGLLSLSIIVLFTVFCYLFTLVLLLNAMLPLFNLFIHKHSEKHLVLNNNFFSPTLKSWDTNVIGLNV